MNRFAPILVARIRALNRRRRIIPVTLQPQLRKLPKIRAVLFDVYGTLVDSGDADMRHFDRERFSRRHLSSALRLAGFRPCGPRVADFVLTAWQELIARQHRLAHARGINYPEVDIRQVWHHALRRSVQRGFLKGKINARAIARVALEFEALQNPVGLLPGVKTALERLQQRGIKMGIVSNAQFYTPLILQVLFGQSLAELGFDRALCVWSYRFLRAKPSPRLLLRALNRIGQKYGWKPREVLVIGNDWYKDLAAARSLGCRTALLAGSQRSFPHPASAVRRWRPDLLLTHWSQLEGIWR